MNSLATELHLLIVGNCLRIDDGSTIRALSGVSRYFRSLTQSHLDDVLYVLVNDPSKYPAIARLADRLCRKNRFMGSAGVRHLAINFAQCYEGMTIVVMDILQAVASSVETLSLTVDSKWHCPMQQVIMCLFSLSLPNLRDLTLFGPFRIRPINPPKTYPTLRRLHLKVDQQDLEFVSTLIFGKLLRNVFPNVENLRLSDCEDEERDQRMLRSVYDHVESSSRQFAAIMPSHVAHFIVSRIVPRRNGRENVLDQTKFARENGRRIRATVRPTLKTNLERDNIRQMWMDGVRGGNGWW